MSMSPQELRALILSAGRPAVSMEPVEGVGPCYFRSLTVGQVDELNAQKDAPRDGFETARSIARILCDEQGNLLFDVNDPADLEQLQGLDVARFNAAATRVQARNAPKEEQGND